MPDLPGAFESIYNYSCCLDDGTLCIMNDESWVTLSQGDREWQINPNLEVEGLKAFVLNKSMCKVFAGNTLIELPPYNRQNFNGLQINGMTIEWSGTYYTMTGLSSRKSHKLISI